MKLKMIVFVALLLAGCSPAKFPVGFLGSLENCEEQFQHDRGNKTVPHPFASAYRQLSACQIEAAKTWGIVP